MKKFIAFLCSFAMAAAAFGGLAACSGGTENGGDTGGGQTDTDTLNGEVVIYHTNDTHGYLEGDGESVIGIDQLAALHKSTENSILVDAGDATQGLPLASLTQGADVIELMNAAGYDVMAAGNHEFDFGSEVLKDNASLADFPILAANVYEGSSPLLAEGDNNGCNTIIEVGGIKVGFFGITTADTANSVNPELLGDVTFRGETETAEEQIDALTDAGADAIVAICHLGDESGGSSCTATQLAEAMTGNYAGQIDVIIDGHSHTVENSTVNGTLIVQAGTGMAGVGQLTLTFDDGILTAEETLLSVADFADIAPDRTVSDKLTEISGSQAEILNQSLGEIPVTLWGGNVGIISIARVVETNLGDLTADAFMAEAEQFMQTNGIDMPLVGVENAGGIRGGIDFGGATMGDLVTAFPYSNTLYLKVVTPAILYQMMEVSGSYIDGQDNGTGMLLQGANGGGFLQIGGFTVVYDATAAAGEEHVLSITLDGQSTPLDRDDTTTQIMLVGNNYILSGGSGYSMLADLPKAGELGGELEAVLTYFEQCVEDGSIDDYIRPDNRIVMQGEYVPADYTAKILIKSGENTAAEGTVVTYVVDGGEEQTATVDANGFISITVTDGAHSVRIAGQTEEAYIDNYLGFGIVDDNFRDWPELTLN